MNETRAKVLQDLLRKERERFKTDQDFADAVGVKYSTMYKWLKSSPVWPDEPNLRIIAAYFGWSVDELAAKCSKSEGKVMEKGECYSVATFENVARLIDKLPNEDKRRVIVYTAEAIAV